MYIQLLFQVIHTYFILRNKQQQPEEKNEHEKKNHAVKAPRVVFHSSQIHLNILDQYVCRVWKEKEREKKTKKWFHF